MIVALRWRVQVDQTYEPRAIRGQYMKQQWRIMCLVLVLVLFGHSHGVVAGDSSSAGGEAISGSAAKSGIIPGTRITMSNWRQFEQFMPDGMVGLFQGSYWWKMPADVMMEVGPT